MGSDSGMRREVKMFQYTCMVITVNSPPPHPCLLKMPDVL